MDIKNADINSFIGVMSIFLRMRMPLDVMTWLITITYFSEEEKKCLKEVALEIDEEMRKLREKELN